MRNRKNRGDKFYPAWVNSKKILTGDVLFIFSDEENRYVKNYFDGKQWVSQGRASNALKEKSRLRQEFVSHSDLVRRTGV
jgi:hypothetical protein